DDDDERPAFAAFSALSSPFIEEDNAGFLREDALLIIVAITDEDEETFADTITAREVYDNLISLKSNPKDVVFLGIGGSRNCWEDGPDGTSTGTYGGALFADNLKRITDLFVEENDQRGVFWDLCTGRLEDGIAEALEVIQRSCIVVD
ncbi:MAG: hypothetical protein AAGC55_16750, partial [Myxococcota bacterium]